MTHPSMTIAVPWPCEIAGYVDPTSPASAAYAAVITTMNGPLTATVQQGNGGMVGS